VTVEVLLPGPHGDKRFVQLAGQAVYERLLEHGVRVWHYQPTMLHAKIMTVDGLVANVGSANFNARSTELDEEINLVALDSDLVRLLDRQFDADLERSEEIQPGRWEDRSIGRRVLEGITRPIRHKM
jgi:cardiolipin synthase